MLAVSRDLLKKLIKEGRDAGKDVSGLEGELKDGIKLQSNVSCCKQASRGSGRYISTGPIRKEDFE